MFDTFTYFSVGLLTRSQYPEDPATGHVGKGFSCFPCVYKRMQRWFPRLQVAAAYFSCSPPDLNFLDPYFIFMYVNNNHCHRAAAHLQLIIITIIIIIIIIIHYLKATVKGKYKSLPRTDREGPEGE